MEKEKLYGNNNGEDAEIIFDFDDASGDDIFISLDDDGDVKIAGGSEKREEKKNGLYGNSYEDDAFYGDELDKDEEDGRKSKEPAAAAAAKNEVNKGFDEQFFNSVYNERRTTVKNVCMIVLVALLLIGLVIFACVYVKKNIINDKTVYEGVKINGYELGGLTKEEVSEYVTKTYFDPINNANITVVLGDEKKTYPLTDFVICPDADEIAARAFEIGRTGTDSERVNAIKALRKNGRSVDIQYEIVTTQLSTIIEEAKSNGFEEVVHPTYSLRDDVISFTSGRNGLEADISKFKSDLNNVLVKFENAISNIENEPQIGNETIKIELIETDFKKLSAEDIYNAALLSAGNASFVRKGSLLTDAIVPAEGAQGRSVNREDLEKIVEKINSGDPTPYFMLRYEYTEPEINLAKLSEILYANVLASVTSENTDDLYSQDKAKVKAARSKNIAKCAELFTGIQLLDGESVNLAAFIGEVSAAGGFVEAFDNLCNGGKMTVGAGVNQFATAVFEAAMRSGLTVNNLTHNVYLPRYGAAGLDAVYDNENGLSIRNTTGNPIKIDCEFENDVLTVNIYGTQSNATAAALTAELTEENASGSHIIRTYTVKRAIGVIEDTYTVSYIVFGGDAPVVTPAGETPAAPTETPADPTTAPTEEPGNTDAPENTEEPGETPVPETPAPESVEPAPTAAPEG